MLSFRELDPCAVPIQTQITNQDKISWSTGENIFTDQFPRREENFTLSNQTSPKLVVEDVSSLVSRPADTAHCSQVRLSADTYPASCPSEPAIGANTVPFSSETSALHLNYTKTPGSLVDFTCPPSRSSSLGSTDDLRVSDLSARIPNHQLSSNEVLSNSSNFGATASRSTGVSYNSETTATRTPSNIHEGNPVKQRTIQSRDDFRIKEEKLDDLVNNEAKEIKFEKDIDLQKNGSACVASSKIDTDVTKKNKVTVKSEPVEVKTEPVWADAAVKKEPIEPDENRVSDNVPVNSPEAQAHCSRGQNIDGRRTENEQAGSTQPASTPDTETAPESPQADENDVSALLRLDEIETPNGKTKATGEVMPALAVKNEPGTREENLPNRADSAESDGTEGSKAAKEICSASEEIPVAALSPEFLSSQDSGKEACDKRNDGITNEMGCANSNNLLDAGPCAQRPLLFVADNSPQVQLDSAASHLRNGQEGDNFRLKMSRPVLLEPCLDTGDDQMQNSEAQQEATHAEQTLLQDSSFGGEKFKTNQNQESDNPDCGFKAAPVRCQSFTTEQLNRVFCEVSSSPLSLPQPGHKTLFSRHFTDSTQPLTEKSSDIDFQKKGDQLSAETPAETLLMQVCSSDIVRNPGENGEQERIVPGVRCVRCIPMAEVTSADHLPPQPIVNEVVADKGAEMTADVAPNSTSVDWNDAVESAAEICEKEKANENKASSCIITGFPSHEAQTSAVPVQTSCTELSGFETRGLQSEESGMVWSSQNDERAGPLSDNNPGCDQTGECKNNAETKEDAEEKSQKTSILTEKLPLHGDHSSVQSCEVTTVEVAQFTASDRQNRNSKHTEAEKGEMRDFLVAQASPERPVKSPRPTVGVQDKPLALVSCGAKEQTKRSSGMSTDSQMVRDLVESMLQSHPPTVPAPRPSSCTQSDPVCARPSSAGLRPPYVLLMENVDAKHLSPGAASCPKGGCSTGVYHTVEPDRSTKSKVQTERNMRKAGNKPNKATQLSSASPRVHGPNTQSEVSSTVLKTDPPPKVWDQPKYPRVKQPSAVQKELTPSELPNKKKSNKRVEDKEPGMKVDTLGTQKLREQNKTAKVLKKLSEVQKPTGVNKPQKTAKEKLEAKKATPVQKLSTGTTKSTTNNSPTEGDHRTGRDSGCVEKNCADRSKLCYVKVSPIDAEWLQSHATQGDR